MVHIQFAPYLELYSLKMTCQHYQTEVIAMVIIKGHLQENTKL